MGAQAEVRRIIGTCQAMTASTMPPVSTASLTAQRRAARDDGEPSTPTTIFVLSADIRTRSFDPLHSYGQLPSPNLLQVEPSSPHFEDQGPGRDLSHRRGGLSALIGPRAAELISIWIWA